MKSLPALPILIGLALVAGCRRDPPKAEADHDHDKPAAPNNRVDIPANVRQNLGITFAKVEKRAVTRTMRVPGAFELLPTAMREYRAAAGGHVELLVAQYQRVDAGRPLCRIDSPRVRELQQQIADAAATVTLTQAAVDSMPPFFDAHEKHHEEIGRSVAMWEARVKQLKDLQTAGGGQATELATASASLSDARIAFAETLEKEAELNARKTDADANLAAAKQKYDLLLASLASLVGRPASELAQTSAAGPVWKTIGAIEVRAVAAGVVSAFGVSSGGQVESSGLVLTVVAPEQVRFRARGYQSDLGKLAAGLPARVVPPAGIADPWPTVGPMIGKLALAPQAAADVRTIDLLVTPERVAAWAIDGVSGFLEITLAGTDAEELAVPSSCVVRDGLMPVLFRRDPANADKVIRLEADVGLSDGRWVVIQSGVAEGNEIVQDGAYQLLVATSGSIAKGGHFHADGTFHDGKD